MPLSNNVITKLNEITSQVSNKKNLSENDEQLIKNVFAKILENGGTYDVDEIESWFENEGTWSHKPTIIRLTNMSHYVQQRFWQNPKKLRVVSYHEECGCD
jgi:hypothetical protein